MKRTISLLLATCLLSIILFNTYASAASATVTDSASYIDTISGDNITLEVVSTLKNTCRSNEQSTITKIKVYRNNFYDHALSVDFVNDVLVEEYADGKVVKKNLSDVVVITSYDNSCCDEVYDFDVNVDTNVTVANSVDYVYYETLDLDANGVQTVLAGAPEYYGYQAMGNRGGYYYAPDTFGYLQRRNAGVPRTLYQNKFEFSAGTTIGTAASIILAFYSSTLGGLGLSLVVAMLGPIIDTIIYDWSVKFEVRTYQWNYRVRLNSNTGDIIYTTYRTKDYYKCYNVATGVASYKYVGSQNDLGFRQSNFELIKYAIDKYLEENVYTQ